VEANSQETGTPPVALEAAKSSAWHATRERREEILVVRIRGCAAGDETALALLYDETSALVYGLALRILRDSAAAEEVTIDVYAQAYRQASRYDPTRGSATAWLLTMTRSRAIDRLRSKSARRRREVSLETLETSPALVSRPAEWLAAIEWQRPIAAALAALPAEQRQLIELAYFGGLTQSEIAATLGLPLGTVKTRIRTAMMKLRDDLALFAT